MRFRSASAGMALHADADEADRSTVACDDVRPLERLCWIRKNTRASGSRCVNDRDLFLLCQTSVCPIPSVSVVPDGARYERLDAPIVVD